PSVGSSANNNLTVSSTSIPSLMCPDDSTNIAGQGNLSYVCNSGFNRAWFSTSGWDGTATPPATAAGIMDWTAGDAKKSGLMFPGTLDGKSPVDYRTNLSAITDGASTTVMVTENNLAGASTNSPYSKAGSAA